MKKSELKELIRPIVKECIQESVREILLDSGLLSAVIKETVKGYGSLLSEDNVSYSETTKQPSRTPLQHNIRTNAFLEQMNREKEELNTHFKQQSSDIVNDMSLKIGGVDVFKGTKANTAAASTVIQEGAANPLNGVDPRDPGVDISRLFGGKKFNIRG